jgi:hypothetical protein
LSAAFLLPLGSCGADRVEIDLGGSGAKSQGGSGQGGTSQGESGQGGSSNGGSDNGGADGTGGAEAPTTAYDSYWEGYAEGYAPGMPASPPPFSDGSSRLRLALSESEGMLLVGNSPEYRPSNDADVFPWIVQLGRFQGEDADHLLIPGFAYTAKVSEQDGLLEISIDSNQPYRAWCELQTPLDAGETFACVPDVPREIGPGACSLLEDPDHPDPIDCGKLTLCEKICTCGEDGCTAKVSLQRVIDGEFEGASSLVGTMFHFGDESSPLLSAAASGESAFRLTATKSE